MNHELVEILGYYGKPLVDSLLEGVNREVLWKEMYRDHYDDKEELDGIKMVFTNRTSLVEYMRDIESVDDLWCVGEMWNHIGGHLNIRACEKDNQEFQVLEEWGFTLGHLGSLVRSFSQELDNNDPDVRNQIRLFVDTMLSQI